ncbi:MAG: diguanylate cyclase [Alphaproteobacteria bacterium]|nr:diguanylate cyclase [Alphaproteobacteria bacterium]
MNGSSDNENLETGAGASDALDLGDETIPQEAREAIKHLISEINALRKEIEANNDRIAELETLADRDPLVPVVNRRAFVRELSRAKAYADRYGGTNCLLYLDIDGMKRLNDQHGHATGDVALMTLADILQQNVRASDLVGRLGGDEFGVLLAQAGRETAEKKVIQLQELIQQAKIKLATESQTLSATFGVIEMTEDMSPEDALEQADKAMYDRKQARRS